ncbi:MAG: hypothetical protein ACREF9_06330 [Opitutaceae bacterium]
MIGERHRAHSEFGGAIDQAINPAAAIEQAVVGVNMKVDEVFVGHRQAAKASRGGVLSKSFSGEVSWRCGAVPWSLAIWQSRCTFGDNVTKPGSVTYWVTLPASRDRGTRTLRRGRRSPKMTACDAPTLDVCQYRFGSSTFATISSSFSYLFIFIFLFRQDKRGAAGGEKLREREKRSRARGAAFLERNFTRPREVS